MDLFKSISNNDLEGFTELLDSGVNPNVVISPELGRTYGLGTMGTSLGITPLIHAVYNSRPKMFKLLLKHGANPYQVDDGGKDVFYYIKHFLWLYRPSKGGWASGHLQPIREIDREIQRWIENKRIEKEIFSPVDDPDSEDSDLIRDDAATRIQRITRGRQTRQRRNLTSKKYGILETPVTRREKIRRLLDLKNQFDKEDPIRGYERFAMYPEGIISSENDIRKGKKKKGGRKKKSKKKKGGRKKKSIKKKGGRKKKSIKKSKKK
tara:strand:- start:162 stop:956 length:795 start_codon:yes stop_codon:yes gene_type:complete